MYRRGERYAGEGNQGTRRSCDLAFRHLFGDLNGGWEVGCDVVEKLFEAMGRPTSSLVPESKLASVNSAQHGYLEGPRPDLSQGLSVDAWEIRNDMSLVSGG